MNKNDLIVNMEYPNQNGLTKDLIGCDNKEIQGRLDSSIASTRDS